MQIYVIMSLIYVFLVKLKVKKTKTRTQHHVGSGLPAVLLRTAYIPMYLLYEKNIVIFLAVIRCTS